MKHATAPANHICVKSMFDAYRIGRFLSQIVDHPETYEREFQWLRAAESYHRLLSSSPSDQVASVLETVGRCYFHAAMQAESRSIFRARINHALATYRRARAAAKTNTFQILRCRAWESFLRFWLTRNAVSKRRTLDKAWVLTERTLAEIERDDDNLEYAQTFDQLSFVYAVGFDYNWNARKRAEKLGLAIEHCRRIIRSLDEHSDRKLLARTCARFALYVDQQGDEGFDQANREKLDGEGLESWRRAVQIDRNAALLAVGYPPAGFSRILDEEESKQVCSDALKVAQKARDNFSVGWQLDQLAGLEFIRGTYGVDQEEGFRILRHSLTLSEKAERKH